MPSSYVCAVCGAPILIGRHNSGWRHSGASREAHRVRPIPRDEYMKKEISEIASAVKSSRRPKGTT